MFRIVLFEPEIPPNAGNVIRLAANTGCELHLIEPLGFSLENRYLRRSGLDYHDLTPVRVHSDVSSVWAHLGQVDPPPRVYAFTPHTQQHHTDISYAPGDVLMFGCESVGLPNEILNDPQVTGLLRLPMMSSSRSVNLSNTTAVAVYEAWRQHDFAGAVH